MGEVIKGRKPKARHRDVVLGAIEERVGCIQEDGDHGHRDRLLELLDELRRSLGRNDEPEEK